MPTIEVTEEALTPATMAAVLALAVLGEDTDGVAPLSEQALLRVRHASTRPTHLLARIPGAARGHELVGYLLLQPGGARADELVAELVVHPEHRRAGRRPRPAHRGARVRGGRRPARRDLEDLGARRPRRRRRTGRPARLHPRPDPAPDAAADRARAASESGLPRGSGSGRSDPATTTRRGSR